MMRTAEETKVPSWLLKTESLTLCVNEENVKKINDELRETGHFCPISIPVSTVRGIEIFPKKKEIRIDYCGGLQGFLSETVTTFMKKYECLLGAIIRAKQL